MELGVYISFYVQVKYSTVGYASTTLDLANRVAFLLSLMMASVHSL